MLHIAGTNSVSCDPAYDIIASMWASAVSFNTQKTPVLCFQRTVILSFVTQQTLQYTVECLGHSKSNEIR